MGIRRLVRRLRRLARRVWPWPRLAKMVGEVEIEAAAQVVPRRVARLVGGAGTGRIELLRGHFAADGYGAVGSRMVELRGAVMDPETGLVVERGGGLNALTCVVAAYYVDVTRPETALRLAEARTATVGGRVLHVFHRSCSAYGHFVLDGLGTIALLAERIRAEGWKIAYPPYLGDWARAALQDCGIGPEMLLPVTEVTRFDRLILPSTLTTTSTFCPGPEMVAALRRLAGVPAAAVPHRRIYLSRAGAYSDRQVTNEAEVEAVFAEAGFEIVVPQHLPFRAQVEAFAQARVIAGNHGSAFANLVFAGPGARVIDLMAEDWIGFWEAGAAERWLLNLTAVCDVDYCALVSPSELIGTRRGRDTVSGGGRIVATTDIARLREVLAGLPE